MKSLFMVILLVTLSACEKQAVILPTETPIPTVVSPTPVPTSTLIPVTVTPSPLPTQPIILMITPDPVQAERWEEYEDALARAFFSSYLTPEEVVCEWVILGQADQEVYVWAHCASIYSAGPSQASIPTVIHIRIDGSVQSAEIPGSGTSYGPDIRQMFPPNIQEMIFDRLVLPSQEQMDRLRWRRGHPDEPPWSVLSLLPTQPTPTVLPMITPDTIQMERWREYQTALASAFLSYLSPEQVLCEWEVLGRSGNEIYVWAVCGESREGLAIIYVGGDVPYALSSDDPTMYPSDVQERYFNGSIHFQELVDHLRERQKHSLAEPPLIILNTKRTP